MKRCIKIVTPLLLCLANGLPAQQGDHWQQVGTENLRAGAGAPPTHLGWAYASMGHKLFVFGGMTHPSSVGSGRLGAVYDVSTDTWEIRPNLNFGIGAPSPRAGAVAVWAGNHVIVWGGLDSANGPAVAKWDGGVYDLATDTWLQAPRLNSGIGAPVSDVHPSYGSQPHGANGGFATWTGTRMLVFGGESPVFIPRLSIWHPKGVFKGGMYDPVNDQWDVRPSLDSEVLPEQFTQALAWTGHRLICRGGGTGVMNLYPQSDGLIFKAGDLYDPSSDSWLQVSTLRSPIGGVLRVVDQTSAWTGEFVLEWGGQSPAPQGGELPTNVGSAFDERGLTFASPTNLISNSGGPSARIGTWAKVWTGSHLLICGGASLSQSSPPAPWPTDGFLYDPVADVWSSPTGINNQSQSAFGLSRSSALSHWTGDRLVVFGGFRLDYANGPSAPPTIVPLLNGGVYHPPRVAPTIRNLAATDPGASASNPLVATVGERFKHRIVCYGTPEAALISTTLPSWLNIGFGGPGPLVAVGTGQGNGGQNGNPPGTGAPFSPWFSAEGLTADGQWLHGTPQIGDAGLDSFTIHAHNGVHPDTATYTVWVEVIIPPGPPSFTTPVPPSAAIAGELYTAPVAAVGPPPVTSINLSGLPWLSYSNGVVSGIPPINTGGTTQGPFTLTASNGHPPDATQLFSLTVAHAYTDVNRDRAVNVTDVQLTVNIILGIAQPQWPEQGDANRDSVVNVIDVQQVVNKILNP